MKGFAPFGYGGPYSSPSNLSPLAPPFTVDSSFPRPVSNPLGHLPEPSFHEPYLGDDPHYAFAARPHHDSWLHMNSPAYGPNVFPNPDTNPSPVPSPTAGTNPIHQTGVPPASTYGQSVTKFFGSQSTSRPYHPQYPFVSIQGSSTSLDLNERPGFASTVRAGDFWNGKSGGEKWKRNDVNVGAPPCYASFVNSGSPAADGLPSYEGPSNVWGGQTIESLAGKGNVESQCTNLPVGKLSSAPNETSMNVSFDMSRASVFNPASFQEIPYDRVPAPDFISESWSQTYPSVASHHTYFTGFDSIKTDPLCFYPGPSAAVIGHMYELSSSIGNPATVTNKNMSTSMTPIERPREAYDRKETSLNRSSSNTGGITVSAESSDVCDDTASINNAVEENDRAWANPTKLKDIVTQCNPLTGVDPMRNLFKGKNNVQVTDLDFPGTWVTAETGAGDFVEYSSEVLEFNPGVDSPCWKGASDSRYSLFEAAEVETPAIPAKISEAFKSFNLQEPQILPVTSVKAVPFSSPDRQINEQCFAEDGSSSFLKHPPLVVSQPSGDHCSSILKTGSDHLEPSNKNPVPSNPDGVSDVQPFPTHNFFSHEGKAASVQLTREDRNASPGNNIKDAAHVGTSWVLHNGSDHYSTLSSPRGNVTVDRNLTEPLLRPFKTFTGCESSRGHVQTVVNSIHKLSELLLSYCSKDGDAEQDHEAATQQVGEDYVTIKQVVRILNTCLERVGRTESTPETQSLESQISNCSEKQTNAQKGTAAGGSQAPNKEVKDVQNRRDIQKTCQGETNSTMVSGKEDDSSPVAFPHGDPELEQDNMVKGIKKILEENLHDEEEPNAQSLLYKNLWLEAEAALCSIKYKERFARMKSEMEKSKQHPAPGVPIVAENLPSPKVTPELNGDKIVESRSKESEDSEDSEISNTSMQDHSSTSSDTEDAGDTEASVMARFRILKSRIDNLVTINNKAQPHDSDNGGDHARLEETISNPTNEFAEDIVIKPQQQKPVDYSVMDRFHILQSRITSTAPANKQMQGAVSRNPLSIIENSSEDLSFSKRRIPWQFLMDSSNENNTPNTDYGSVMSGEENPSSYLVSDLQDLVELGVTRSLTAGGSNSPSSDWEHVLKDAAWPA